MKHRYFICTLFLLSYFFHFSLLQAFYPTSKMVTLRNHTQIRDFHIDVILRKFNILTTQEQKEFINKCLDATYELSENLQKKAAKIILITERGEVEAEVKNVILCTWTNENGEVLSKAQTPISPNFFY